jgi:hypothetical protein
VAVVEVVVVVVAVVAVALADHDLKVFVVSGVRVEHVNSGRNADFRIPNLMVVRLPAVHQRQPLLQLQLNLPTNNRTSSYASRSLFRRYVMHKSCTLP